MTFVKEVSLCPVCGSRVLAVCMGKSPPVTREQVEKMALEYCRETEWPAKEQLDIAAMHVSDMLRAAGFEIEEAKGEKA